MLIFVTPEPNCLIIVAEDIDQVCIAICKQFGYTYYQYKEGIGRYWVDFENEKMELVNYYTILRYEIKPGFIW